MDLIGGALAEKDNANIQLSDNLESQEEELSYD